MAYRGPQTGRIQQQFAVIREYAGETGIWRQWVSASTGTGSGIYAGLGTTDYYRQQVITGLWRFATQQEMQSPGGMIAGGEVMISTVQALGRQDEIIWRGITYRIEGDSLPAHLGGRNWFQTVLVRGDVTG